MSRLTHIQWSKLNAFVLELHSDHSQEHFFRCCLEVMPGLMQCVYVGWNEFNSDFQILSCRQSAVMSAEVMRFLPGIETTLASHPVVYHVLRERETDAVGETYAISDFITQRELRDRAIHAEAYRHLGIRDQMYTELQFTPCHRSGLTFNADRPFTSAQKGMARVLREHLLSAYRNVLRAAKPATLPEAPVRRQDLQAPLSPRLRETLDHLLKGHQRKRIADEMNLSQHTLNEYVAEVYRRFNVHSHAELVCLFQSAPPQV